MKEYYNTVKLFQLCFCLFNVQYFFIFVYPTLLNRTKDITTLAYWQAIVKVELSFKIFSISKRKYPRNKTNWSFI